MSDAICRDYAGRDYVENNRQSEHRGGTGPSWRDAYEPPECWVCGCALTWERDHYYCDGCDLKYTAEEVG